MLLGHHHHQATTRRNRRRGRATIVPCPKGHLHQPLAHRINRDEAFDYKLRHYLPLATAVIELEADLRQQQMTVVRAQCQHIVWRTLCRRYCAVPQFGWPLAADDFAIVQPQQIHPLGANRIRGLIVGVEPNGKRADHLVRFFCCYLWGAEQGPSLGEDEEEYPHDSGDNADAAKGDKAPSQPVEGFRSRRDPALMWLGGHAPLPLAAIVWNRARAGGPSFPRKRESSGERLHIRADIRRFQTAS